MFNLSHYGHDNVILVVPLYGNNRHSLTAPVGWYFYDFAFKTLFPDVGFSSPLNVNALSGTHWCFHLNLLLKAVGKINSLSLFFPFNYMGYPLLFDGVGSLQVMYLLLLSLIVFLWRHFFTWCWIVFLMTLKIHLLEVIFIY